MTKYMKQNKKIILPILALLIFMPLIFISTQVFSLDKLNMKISYVDYTDEKQTWDLKETFEFNQDWVTNKETVKFTVDLKEYYKKIDIDKLNDEEDIEKNEIEIPFDYEIAYNNENINNHVTVKEKVEGESKEFKGAYDVTVSLDKALKSKEIKDGILQAKLKIKEENSWEIPTGRNPIEFKIVRDTVKPDVKMNGVEEGKVYTKDEFNEAKYPTMDIEVNDDYLDNTELIIARNGKDYPEDKIKQGDTYKFTEDGKYEVKVQAIDKAGNENEVSSGIFYVHNEEPETNVVVDGILIEGDDIVLKEAKELEIEAINTPPIDKAFILVHKDGELYAEIEAESIKENVARWQETFQEDGYYEIQTLIMDNHNNESKEHIINTAQFTIKTDGPNIITSGIEDQQVFHIGGTWLPKQEVLEVEVKDEHLSSVSITVNDEETIFDDGDEVKESYSFSDNGKHTVLITAKDKAGNEVSEKLVFYIHTEEPELNVFIADEKLDKENIYINKSQDIDFMIENSIPINDAEIIVLKDGEKLKEETLTDINANNKKWSHLFEDEGDYTVQFRVIDDNQAGEQYIHELDPVQITVDKTKPVITVTEDNNEVFHEDLSREKEVTVEVLEKNFDEQTTHVTVLDEENNPVKVTFPNWKKKDGSSNVYTTTQTFKRDGKYKLDIQAEDKATNKDTFKSDVFTIDRTAPELTIDGVEDGEHYNQNTVVDIKVKDSYLNKDNTSLKIEKYNKSKEIFEVYDIGKELEYSIFNIATLSHEFDEEGTFRITLSAIDLAGNEAVVEIVNFTIDKTAPVLKVENVEDGLYYSEGRKVTISIDEYHYGTNNVTFKVTKNGQDITNEVEKNVGNEWKNGDEKVFLDYDFDQDGLYEIQLKAIDKAGNKGTEQIKEFTIDQKDPKITIKGVEDQTHYSKTKSVDVSIEDANLNKNTIEVTKDGKKYDIGEFITSGEETLNQFASLKHEFKEEGTYIVKVEAVDHAQNKSTQEVTFVIDKTDPFIQLNHSYTSHMTSDYIKEKGINELIQLELNEINLKEKEVFVTRVNNDGKKERFTDEEIGKWEETKEGKFGFQIKDDFFEKDGSYSFEVTASDYSGRKSEEKLPTLTVDNIKPIITLANIKRYNDGPVTEVITVTEHNYHKNKVKYEVFKENKDGEFKPYDKFGEWKNSAKKSTLSLPFKEDGKYKVVVNATDDAGNKAKEKVSVFTVDTIKPDISLQGVENTDKVIHYNEDKGVIVDIKDTNIDKKRTKLEIKKLNRATGKMEDYDTNKELTFTKTRATFSHNFSTKDEGVYSIKVSSTDKAGNKADDKFVTFVIDKTAPLLSIKNVDNNAYYASNKNVTISVNEENYQTNNVTFSVTRNGQDITSQVESSLGRAWRTSKKQSELTYLFNQDGEYEIVLNATDAAGNKAKGKKVTFTIDKVNPHIDISGVDNTEHYNKDMPVNITIKDVNFKTNRIQVTKDGRSYNVGGFSVKENLYSDSIATLNHTFSQEGVYEIVVESIDQAGNQSMKKVEFTIDKTPPVITPTMKENGTTLKDGQYINQVFTPQFVLDNQKDEIVSVKLNNGSNIANNIPIASKEMVYNFDVLARDKAGNETTLKISFTLDTTKPELNISGIIEGFFNKELSPYVSYSDKHLDESKSFVTLNNQPYSNGTVLTEEGDYILKTVATDLADNVSERTIVFTIDKTAPVIRFEEEIGDKYFNETIIPSIFIEDMSDYDIISLTLNGEPYTLGDPIESEGKHVMHFEVKDKAGNIQQLTVEFIIDKTPPNIIVNGVENNTDYYETVQLEVLLDNPEDTIKSVLLNGKEVTGQIIDNDGVETLKLGVKEIASYELEIEAYDEAGNIANSVLAFNIVEKSFVTKLYENKPALAGTIIAGLLLLSLLLFALLKRKKTVE